MTQDQWMKEAERLADEYALAAWDCAKGGSGEARKERVALFAHLQQRHLPVREGADERMRHDYPVLQQFHTKHALGAKAAPSCLCCGQQTHPITRPISVQHMELPAIVVCKQCKDASASPSVQNMGEGETGKDGVNPSDGGDGPLAGQRQEGGCES